MLDGLLGRGFTSKCKSSIKLTKARIDEIRRKRNAMQKFLKKDVADLLENGLDINAYGRAEGLLVELNYSSCYDLVEEFCQCVYKQISVMQKQRECPEECREAVPSLMFAAARFADLPELRDLRQSFAERYGNSLESFVNQEFAEKMAAKPPTREKKLQLMRDIAKEFSIKWDSKAFEQNMSNPPAYVPDQSKKQGSLHHSNDGYKLRKMEDTAPVIDTHDVSSRGRRELTHDGYQSRSHGEQTVPKKDNQAIFSNGRREFSDDGRKVHSSRGDTTLKRDNQEVPARGRQEQTDNGYKLREDTVPKKDNPAILSNGRREFSDDGRKVHNSRGAPTLKRDNLDIPTQGRQELTDDGNKLRNEREDTFSKREFIHDGYKSRSHREDTVTMKDNRTILPNGRRELGDDGRQAHNSRGDTTLERDNHGVPTRGREELTDNGYKMRNEREDAISKRDGHDVSSRGWREISSSDKHKPHRNRDDSQLRREHQDLSYHGRWEADAGYKPKRDNLDGLSNGGWGHIRDAHKQRKGGEETESLKPFCNNIVPPPYTKPRSPKYGTNSEENGYGDEKEDHLVDVVGDAKPRPRSVRRRHLKPPPGHDSIVNFEYEEAVRRNPSVRKEDARQGLQILSDDGYDSKYEEEKMMDKLLLHYSKKQPSAYEHGKMRKGSKAPPSHDSAADTGRPPRQRSRDEAHLNRGLGHFPARAVSLPPEPTSPTELPRGPARARSFQPDGQVAHVHPKLPDYDDLAARVAALRGT